MTARKHEACDLTIALAGNPNVGKTTVFNGLTGQRQHTGNWIGKTVTVAQGTAKHEGRALRLVDLPGCYSLSARSAEEAVARDFICFSPHDATVVVCDATCLARNLMLALQIAEVEPCTVVCVNLLDAAARSGITVDLAALSRELGIPVVGVSATRKQTLSALLYSTVRAPARPLLRESVNYGAQIEAVLQPLADLLAQQRKDLRAPRFWVLRLLENDTALTDRMPGGVDDTLAEAAAAGRAALAAQGIEEAALRDAVTLAQLRRANEIAERVTTVSGAGRAATCTVDRVLTGRRTAFPFMLLLLSVVLFLTVIAANLPSEGLSRLFAAMGSGGRRALEAIGLPPTLIGLLIDGIWSVLGTVVAVMLPPMIIFFTLFTLLEDVGYLPRVAYDLDRPLCRCHACGKQALTLCMGLGCNAVGVTGCRIIDSPRERLLAILTNCFVPCNGRFPTMIALITVFFAGAVQGAGQGLLVAVLLGGVIVLGILMTLLTTYLLSVTLLRGTPSAFVMELPPYRVPRLGRALLRAVGGKALRVLGRAVAVAVPAGAVIFLLATLQVEGESLLAHAAAFLEPLGRLLGLDGAILLGFILGFPANEIVLPIVLMIYLSAGTVPTVEGASAIGEILTANGWTGVTALCFILFSLMHWPCATTVLTVKRETGSLRWTAVAILLPTLLGILTCALVNAVAHLSGLV